jgi:kumamolisin
MDSTGFCAVVIFVLACSLETLLPASAMAEATSCSTATSELTRTLQGHIPQAMRSMTDEGKLDEQQAIPVTIALRLNNEAELDREISEIYREGSSSFHQFLTPDEFKAKFSPTQEQVDREISFLEANGISVQSVSDNRVLVRAQGSVGALNQVFSTELHQYHRANGKTYFGPTSEPQVPVGSQISAIVGLNNVAQFHSHVQNHVKISEFSSSKKKKTTAEGNAPGGGLAPADIAKAYDLPASVDGSGQTLALFELDGYAPSDIAAYEKEFNLPTADLQNVMVDGATGAAGDGAIEVVLDIEMMIAVAPKASKIVVYEGPNSSQGVIDTYAKIANDNVAKQVSTSWGQAESQSAAADLQSENTIFKQMVAQGQALYAAAGDSGAEDDGSALSVDDPSSQPYVVAVGGTKLTIGSNSAFKSETTWNELSSNEGAGGGGVSKVWSLPSWQKGAATADSQASRTMRNTPDVSLNADPTTGYGIYQGGKWQVVGGTSAAAPLWAAFTALVNQQRADNQVSAIGFTAPALYAIGESSGAAAAFNDIVSGTNGTGSNSFSAFKGYDNASGWGSFKGSALLESLAK